MGIGDWGLGIGDWALARAVFQEQSSYRTGIGMWQGRIYRWAG